MARGIFAIILLFLSLELNCGISAEPNSVEDERFGFIGPTIDDIEAAAIALVFPLIGTTNNPQFFKYYLYNDPSNPDKFTELFYDEASGNLSHCNFHDGEQLIILVHGYVANATSPFPLNVKDAYLERARNQNAKVNILIFDWSSLATSPSSNVIVDIFQFLPNYLYAASNVLIPGKRLSEVIKYFILNDKAPLANLHLVGHSIGAHVSGAAGMYFREDTGMSIPRITALDPAGPLFVLNINYAVSEQDADFVDAIQTTRYTYGKYENFGGVQFIPNYGVILAEGCRSIKSAIIDIVSLGGCSHQYAPLVFAESINDPHVFGVKLNDFAYAFSKGIALLPVTPTYTATVGEYVELSAARGMYKFDGAEFGPNQQVDLGSGLFGKSFYYMH